MDAWQKDITPSDGLRRWVHADPSRWEEFTQRYRTELDTRRDHVELCLDRCRQGPVTLLTAARDRERNHALVLRDYLTACLEEEGSPP